VHFVWPAKDQKRWPTGDTTLTVKVKSVTKSMRASFLSIIFKVIKYSQLVIIVCHTQVKQTARWVKSNCFHAKSTNVLVGIIKPGSLLLKNFAGHFYFLKHPKVHVRKREGTKWGQSFHLIMTTLVFNNITITYDTFYFFCFYQLGVPLIIKSIC